LIETGWPVRVVQSFSPAKLFLVFEQSRARRVRRELRDLINATAANAGGKAAQERFRQIEKELRGGKTAEPKCETPLNQEDFEAMMKEDDAGS